MDSHGFSPFIHTPQSPAILMPPPSQPPPSLPAPPSNVASNSGAHYGSGGNHHLSINDLALSNSGRHAITSSSGGGGSGGHNGGGGGSGNTSTPSLAHLNPHSSLSFGNANSMLNLASFSLQGPSTPFGNIPSTSDSHLQPILQYVYTFDFF